FAICFACTGQQSPREVSAGVASARGSDYLSYIPEEANLLFYANVQELKRSRFGRNVTSEFETRLNDRDRDYIDFVEKTGVDPEKDIYEIWLSGEARNEYGENYNGAAIIRGNLNERRILEYIKENSDRRSRKERYEGVDLYIVEERRDEQLGYAFLDSKTMIVGTPFWLERIIDLSKDRGGSIFDNSHMSDYIDQIPHRQHIWGVVDARGLSDQWARRFRTNSGFRGTESLENIESMLFYAEFDNRANIHVEGNFGTAEQAELLEESLNGLKAVAKLIVSDDRDAIDMLNEIKIRSRGQTLNISAQLEQNFFDKLEQKSKRFSGQSFKF
ncbi:hypothetical protein MJD09_07560, partial [bacterium]|nr:hypothetical protein [bacterium]